MRKAGDKRLGAAGLPPRGIIIVSAPGPKWQQPESPNFLKASPYRLKQLHEVAIGEGLIIPDHFPVRPDNPYLAGLDAYLPQQRGRSSARGQIHFQAFLPLGQMPAQVAKKVHR